MTPCAIVPLPQTVDPVTAFSAVGGEAPLIRVVHSVQTLVTDAHLVVATVPVLASRARACLDEANLHAVAVIAARAGSRPQILGVGLEHLRVERDSTVPVLICDVRHPLSTAEVADRVLAALPDRDAVVPTRAVTDTVKTVDDVGRMLGTVDRATLRAVQYPVGFTGAALWRLISVPWAAGEGDEVAVAVRTGVDVGTVAGDANAFQVELPRDSPLLEAIIACRRG